MEKEFVPYELAVKLKELGFDESCFGFYYDDGELKIKEGNISRLGYINAPTFSQAFRWFREKHNYDVVVSCSYNLGKKYYYRIETSPTIGFQTYNGNYKTYEEAELACLDKLIEIVESKNK
jgi:hypothetical protein